MCKLPAGCTAECAAGETIVLTNVSLCVSVWCQSWCNSARKQSVNRYLSRRNCQPTMSHPVLQLTFFLSQKQERIINRQKLMNDSISFQHVRKIPLWWHVFMFLYACYVISKLCSALSYKTRTNWLLRRYFTDIDMHFYLPYMCLTFEAATQVACLNSEAETSKEYKMRRISFPPLLLWCFSEGT